jgi:sugar diacid utilization regulator
MSEVKTDGYVNDDEYNDKMRIERNSYLIQTEQLTEQLEQQTQDFHFDMRNKQMELVVLENRYADLERENKELRKLIKETKGE